MSAAVAARPLESLRSPSKMLISHMRTFHFTDNSRSAILRNAFAHFTVKRLALRRPVLDADVTPLFVVMREMKR
jgi:hypothetical protein